jgi:sterol desaturase/sphingolipid hydroxylase (fatty acid hydroxylase superfamily)
MLMGPAWLLGLPAQGLVAYRIVSAFVALFEHMNVRVATGVELIHFHRFHRGPVIHPVARRRTCAVRSGVEARA